MNARPFANLSVAAVLCATLRTMSAQPCPTFLLTPSYPTEVNSAEAVATGDFTSDGIIDVVTFGGYISVLPGGGSGAFGPPIATTPFNSGSGHLVVADFDDDGNQDLASGDHTVTVYLGNGDGTFEFAGSYEGESFARGFAVGYFDDDDVPDLALAMNDFSDNGVAIYLGYGDGTFQAPVVYGQGPLSLAVADFNEDGRDDVATPQFEGTVAIYLSAPDGTLSAPSFVPVGSDPRGSVAGHLDGDGHADLVVALPGGLVLLYGNGNGTFDAPESIPVVGQLEPRFLLDADGDGRTDIVGSRAAELGIVEIRFQTAPGVFDSSAAYQSAHSSAGIATGEFTGDGRPDYVSAGGFSEDLVDVFLWSAPGLAAVPLVMVPVDPGPVAAGDFDGDGTDEVVSGYSFDELGVTGRDADGRYQVLGVTDLGSDPSFDTTLVAADLDADGQTDVTLVSGSVYVLLSDGDYTFSPAPSQPLVTQAAPVAAAADFDGNSTIDLAVFILDGSELRAATLRGNGDGTFQDPVLGPAAAHQPRGLVAADLDGDGAVDLVAVNGGGCCGEASDTVTVFLGNGDGTFRPPNDYAAGPSPNSIASADFDGDGHPDLVTSNSASTNVSILLSDGHGGLKPQILVAVAWSPTSVAAADFDGDGLMDVATASGGSGNGSGRIVTLLRGIGGAAFDAPEIYSTVARPVFVAAGKFDGTGATGLAVSNGDFFGGASVEFFLPAGLTVAGISGPDTAMVSTALTLHVSAMGPAPISYEWRRDGTPLADGGSISGATTATLTIDPVGFPDAGSYEVLVTGACGSVAAATAEIAVEFADVPLSSPFHDDIRTIATSGITGGCGGGNYCPTSPVRRDQMAVLLLRSKHGPAYKPPACGGVFSDVPCPGPFTDWIEQLAAEGVTGGCGGGRYCPSPPVTRAQMAVFLLKTSEGESFTPSPATGIFEDVPAGSFAADFIEDLHSRGITGGCSTSPLLYCPGSAVLRQQMATFLVRTFAP
jgi:hypothetical protein